jgi:aminoglycoside phosphotransferase (APT) family kinase protein
MAFVDTDAEANTGTKPVPEKHRFDTAPLEAWMAANVPGYAGPLELRQFKGGQSNPTYQLITPTAKYVLRRKPPGKLLPSAHAVDREFKVVGALGRAGFPVARVYGLCTDEAVIGTWFYVMDMVEGRVLWAPSLPQQTPQERRAIYEAMVRTLAQLHSVDYAALGLSDFGKPGNYMGRQVERWSKQYKASEAEAVPEMDRLIAWLPTALPPQERTSIVHGDFRLDNMIFHPAEPRVLAVLDWELATLGEPLADLTYMLISWIGGPLAEIPDLAAHGIPTIEEVAALYCRLTGRPGVPDLNWFLAYNAFRLAAILQGVGARVRDGTANHPDALAMAARVPGLAKVGWEYARRAGAAV